MIVAYGTILDRAFLPQALALYRSYERVVPVGRFYFFAMDEVAEAILTRLALPRAVVVSAAAIRRPELESQKAWRSFAEYCWASKPLVMRCMLEQDVACEWVVYLDSDMAFFADPTLALPSEENAIGCFTPHRFSPTFVSLEHKVGHHNGGFAAFRKCGDSVRILERWFHDCLKRPDHAGRKGETFDQKILDEIVVEEQGVRSIFHPGLNLAPWNFDSYTISYRGGAPFVDDKPVIIYHYQSLRMHSARIYTLYNSDKPIPRSLRKHIYHPYLRQLQSALADIRRVAPGYRATTYEIAPDWRNRIRILVEAMGGKRSVVGLR